MDILDKKKGGKNPPTFNNLIRINMTKGDRIIVILCLLMTVFCIINAIVFHSMGIGIFFNVMGLISLLPILPLLNNKQ